MLKFCSTNYLRNTKPWQYLKSIKLDQDEIKDGLTISSPKAIFQYVRIAVFQHFRTKPAATVDSTKAARFLR
ncbi:MAG: hypothetical protein A3K07_02090 [Candidatus Doudnabacteria bacterium RIFCSPHIGHO2_01_43_10]|nr:MAG: hypothetical protein A3K07_02090 [Candidatus Doudnabacteria bacterium RIFCSPHIGHO2_01_43_10]OGE98252.1 MAG: hypothetical protein A3G89_00530 [Candidatus Doudnabacteria bacterium RIFCSPLOWO2_12_FULL_42_9]